MAFPGIEPRIPFDQTLDAVLDFEVDEPGADGSLRGRMPVAPRVCQPMGIVHGGAYATIAESLASRGTALAVMGDGKMALGMSNSTSFLRPITEGTIHGEARPFHRGRTTWIWDVEMRDDEGRLCAVSRVTIAVRDRT